MRFLVGRFDKGKTHPLLTALSRIITTHIIEPAPGSDFVVCVLGKVDTLTGGQPETVRTTSVAVSPHQHGPEFWSIDIQTPIQFMHVDQIE